MSWPQFWTRKTWQSYLLFPLSKFVCWEAARRLRHFEDLQVKSNTRQTPATVVVVGNVVVGGTGKTPFIIWLTKQLQQQGLKVGIISRGYGAKSNTWPVWVDSNTQASQCGDEPLMLFKQTGCPVAVSPKRVEALDLLNQKAECDIIISDDGLQHYALQRDIEVVLIDAQRVFGNGWCMPAGPLREPLDRIAKVEFTVWNGLQTPKDIPKLAVEQKAASTMQLKPHRFCSVGNPQNTLSIEAFIEKYPHQSVVAMAGIGNPKRFFETLSQLGFEVKGHEFADHYAYQADDLERLLMTTNEQTDVKPLIMTEKDAVKCTEFAGQQSDWWYLQVEPECDQSIVDEIVYSHQQRNTQYTV